jgi:peroxiredoxin Q/BCP
VKKRQHRTGLLAATLAAAAILTGPVILAGDEKGAIMLESGAAAPGFTLVGSDGETYSLADLQAEAPVVIAWFPKAFTGG